MDFINEQIKKALDTSVGGVLTDEQLEGFLSAVQDQNQFLRMIHVQPVKSSTFKIPAFNINTRQLRAVSENTEITLTITSSFNTNTINLVETAFAEDISLSWLEESTFPSEEAGQQAVEDALAEQFSNDLADLAVNGSGSSADPFIGITNGFLAQAQGDTNVNKVSIASGSAMADVFKTGSEAMPDKWKNRRENLVYFVSHTKFEDYLKELGDIAASRAFDFKLFGAVNNPISYLGSPVVPINFMPDTRILYCSPDNLWAAIGRQIRRDVEWKPRKRAWEYTLSTKVGFNFGVSEAVVDITLT